jgi:hypothetical protein
MAYILKPLSPVEQIIAQRMRSSLMVTEYQEREFARRADPDGGVTLSFVEIAERMRAERLRSKGRAA